MAELGRKVVSPPVINGIVDPNSMSYRLIKSNYQYSVQSAINIDFSKKKGIGVVRDGTSQVGNDIPNADESLGATIFYKAGNNQTIRIIAVREGSVSKVYYNSGSGWILSGITAGPLSRYRFAVLDDILYVADGGLMKQTSDGITYTNHTAVNSNCLNQNVDNVIQRRGRLIAYKGDTHYISGVIGINGSINWEALDAGNFQLAPFDGGRSTGYLQVGRYLFLSKTNGVYRLDADSASVDPDNLFGVGAITAEALTYCQQKGYFFSGRHLYELSQNGVSPIDDTIDHILSKISQPANIFMGANEFDIFIYIGQLVIDDFVYDNLVLKYNVVYNSYSFFNYDFAIKFFSQDPNTKELYAVGENRMVKLLDQEESTDIGKEIFYRMKWQDFVEGSYSADINIVSSINIYSKHAQGSHIIVYNQNGQVQSQSEKVQLELDKNNDITIGEIGGGLEGKLFQIMWEGIRKLNTQNPEMIEMDMYIKVGERDKPNREYK